MRRASNLNKRTTSVSFVTRGDARAHASGANWQTRERHARARNTDGMDIFLSRGAIIWAESVGSLS